jgi:signal transduction histidine kinase
MSVAAGQASKARPRATVAPGWTLARTRGLAARAEARRWLGRELHDGPVQTLTAVIVELETLRRERDEDCADRARLDRVTDSTRDVMRELRGLLYELRAEAAIDEDVAAGLRTLLQEFTVRTGIAAELAAPSHRVRLPGPTAAEVRCILGEALTNVSRHSGARSVQVALQVIDAVMAVTVTDDGRGFESAITRPGVGLRGMHERAQLIRARLTVDGTANGTKVRLLVPLDGDR